MVVIAVMMAIETDGRGIYPLREQVGFGDFLWRYPVAGLTHSMIVVYDSTRGACILTIPEREKNEQD